MSQYTTVSSGLPHATNSHDRTTTRGGGVPAFSCPTAISSACSSPFDTAGDDPPAGPINWTCEIEGGFLDDGTTAQQQELTDDGEASQHKSAKLRTNTTRTRRNGSRNEMHNRVDRRYNAGIKNLIQDLLNSLPPSAQQNPTKAQVLERAIKYIQLSGKQMREAEANLGQAHDRIRILMEENQRLKYQLEGTCPGVKDYLPGPGQ